MGAFKSTARSNATNDDNQDSHQETNASNGTSIWPATAIATAAAGAAVATWSISKMLSENTQSQEKNYLETRPQLLNPPYTKPEGIKKRSVWSPPPPGRFKINTAGGCHPILSHSVGHDLDHVQRGPSGYGGILRDHNGNWVQGFLGSIGESDYLTSTLHAILKGLEMLDNMKIKGSVLETDCQAVYELVTREGDWRSGKSETIRACWLIIVRCRQLVFKNDVAVKLILRDDTNICANKLANMGIQWRQDYVETKDVPMQLKYLVEKDATFLMNET